jgi:putative ubiquitin-RnfH superfamily antitoxin RatB of RatAB toxin-antitoxin module
VNADITITLLYSPAPRVVDERTLRCAAGTTVEQALDQSGLLHDHPDIALHDADAFVAGIWGRKTTPNQVLRDLDRIEIYRALTVDPMVARRERFQKQGAGRTGLFSKRRPGAKPGY